VYCSSAVRVNSASILAALNRFSNTPRAITQIGLCVTNGSNTWPSEIAIFVPPCKNPHLLQGGTTLPKNINTLEGLHLWAQCKVPLNACVIRYWNRKKDAVDHIVLVTTDQRLQGPWIVRHYEERPEIEQDYEGSLVFPGVQSCGNINKLCRHVYVSEC